MTHAWRVVKHRDWSVIVRGTPLTGWRQLTDAMRHAATQHLIGLGRASCLLLTIDWLVYAGVF
jgi:hypothetical protein